MKRYIALAALLGILISLLSGCGFWMDGERIYLEPHQQQEAGGDSGIVPVNSFVQMQNALLALVEEGREEAVFSVADFYGGSVHFYLDNAIRLVKESSPMGAYAVEDITYEIGTNAGEAAIAIKIRYRYERARILRVGKADNMEEALMLVGEALDACESYVAVRVPAYEKTDLEQWVRDYAAANPHIVMEVPKVYAVTYPDSGNERIVELSFTYQTSRESLLNMQQIVEPVFTAAELYLRNTSQTRDKYARLYSFLMERSEYTLETSITPAYSLLNHGVGDDKAFATVYAAMCKRAGLSCTVISGTRDGAPWSWNLIKLGSNYYHLDLLRCAETGDFSLTLQSQLAGYVWDYSAYPG
ncbi:MAG: transglutaminase domain-containing protein [Oscillospiraceae bacterium]|nr:transglutaminase domain-containing protein [Oscillospiraceae bacterium]